MIWSILALSWLLFGVGIGQAAKRNAVDFEEVDDVTKPQEVVQFVVIGATGDLARKYLWQSMFAIWAETGQHQLQVFSMSRSADGGDIVRKLIEEGVDCTGGEVKGDTPGEFARACSRARSDFAKAVVHVTSGGLDSYEDLSRAMNNELERVRSDGFVRLAGRVFHMAVPPGAYKKVGEGLIAHALAGEDLNAGGSDEKGRAGPFNHVVVEKPVGTDAENAQEVLDVLTKGFGEQGVLLADHYMGKAGAASLVSMRRVMGPGMGGLLHWSFLSSVEVVIEESERVGKERTELYEAVGGVGRDMLQSHAMTLAALALAPLEATGANRDITIKAVDGPASMPQGEEGWYEAMLHVQHPEAMGKPVRVVNESHPTGLSAGELLTFTEGDSTVDIPFWGDLPPRRRLVFPPSDVTPRSRTSFLRSLKIARPSVGRGKSVIAGQYEGYAAEVDGTSRTPTAMRASFIAGATDRSLATLRLADSVLTFSDGRGGVFGRVENGKEDVEVPTLGFEDDIPSGTTFGGDEPPEPEPIPEDPGEEHGPNVGEMQLPRTRRSEEDHPPTPEAGAPQLLGVPVVVVAAKQAGERRAMVRYTFGRLGRLTVLLQGSVPVVLPANDSASEIPDDHGPTHDAVETVLAENGVGENDPRPRAARVHGPAIILERPRVQNQQLSRPEEFPPGFRIVAGGKNYTDEVVIALLTTDPRRDGPRALAAKKKLSAVDFMTVSEAHAMLTRPWDAYTSVLAAACAGDRSRFVAPQEVLANWDLWGPVLHKFEEENEPVRLHTPGDLSWMGIDPLAASVRCDDPKCCLQNRGRGLPAGAMAPPLRDAFIREELERNKTQGKHTHNHPQRPLCVLADPSPRVAHCPDHYLQ